MFNKYLLVINANTLNFPNIKVTDKMKSSILFIFTWGYSSSIHFSLGLAVLTLLPIFFFFLLSFKKSIYFQWVFSCWNHSPLWKSIWFPRCLCPGFQRGSSITGVIDLGWVPFSEPESTSAIWLSDEYIAHLAVRLYFISQENRDMDGNFAARKK